MVILFSSDGTAHTYDTKDITVCSTECAGDERKLRDCRLRVSKSCACYDGAVGITCSEYNILFYLG